MGGLCLDEEAGPVPVARCLAVLMVDVGPCRLAVACRSVGLLASVDPFVVEASAVLAVASAEKTLLAY